MSAAMDLTEVNKRLIMNNESASCNGSAAMPNMQGPINQTIQILTIVILFITMISLGCTMEISKIKAYLLKPKGVAIGLMAQFCIMPITAFGFARLFKMDCQKAVVVLICGCCPGGSLSNIFSLVVKGDMNLSIVMTTCSSIAALGLMPLLLYIFSKGFTGLENILPYADIIKALAFTLVPCAFGIAINHFKPNIASVVKKVGLSILIISSIIVCILSFYNVRDMLWEILQPDVLTVASLMPLIGFTLGYVMSVSCRLSPQCSRTISMETGCQNIQLCFAILKMTFDLKGMGAMFLFPLLYITFQCTEVFVFALCFRCYQRVKPPAEDTRRESQSTDDKYEQVKQP